MHKKLPVPPQLADKQKKLASPTKNNSAILKKVEAVMASSLLLNDEPISGDREAIFKRLQADLMQQIKIATANFKHFTNMGDVTNANK